MTKKWENDSCEAVQAYYTVYPVPMAAALWCGVPIADVAEVLKECTQDVRGILKHPYISCLEPRCRAIHDAMLSGVLPYSRENGKLVPEKEHVAPERRHVSRRHLKEWIAEHFPSDKPEFLFDELERNTHSAINADTFRALQADRDALKARIDKATEEYLKLKTERNALAEQLASIKADLEKQKPLDPRSETTYLNIVGAMVSLCLMQSPSGRPYSVFESQAALIDQLVANFSAAGITKRTLEEKFAAAKRSLGQ